MKCRIHRSQKIYETANHQPALQMIDNSIRQSAIETILSTNLKSRREIYSKIPEARKVAAHLRHQAGNRSEDDFKRLSETQRLRIAAFSLNLCEIAMKTQAKAELVDSLWLSTLLDTKGNLLHPLYCNIALIVYAADRIKLQQQEIIEEIDLMNDSEMRAFLIQFINQNSASENLLRAYGITLSGDSHGIRVRQRF